MHGGGLRRAHSLAQGCWVTQAQLGSVWDRPGFHRPLLPRMVGAATSARQAALPRNASVPLLIECSLVSAAAVYAQNCAPLTCAMGKLAGRGITLVLEASRVAARCAHCVVFMPRLCLLVWSSGPLLLVSGHAGGGFTAKAALVGI